MTASGFTERPSIGTSRVLSAPALAVVLASTRSRAQLDACLASLLPQCQRSAVSLVVVRADSPDAVAQLRADTPGIRVIGASPSASKRELRRLGMVEAASDIVALTDDDQVRDPNWVSGLRQGRRMPNEPGASDSSA